MSADPGLITALDHVQVAMPRGEEERARTFYSGVLGLREVTKPTPLATRGGVWFTCGAQMVHLGVEDGFVPQRKAHPALLVRDLAALRARMQAAGCTLIYDDALPGYERFYAADPFGNRLEFLASAPSASSEAMGILNTENTEDMEQMRAEEIDHTANPGDGETSQTNGAPAASEEQGAGIKDRVRETFGRNAGAYVTSVLHATGDDLRRLVELAGPVGTEHALDLSTGGGHAALALAPHVARMTVTDLTPPMLVAARAHLRARGVANCDYVLADAERLPFLGETFELVTVRIAPHHYADPQRAMHEVARVLMPGGRFVLIDNVAPEDALLDRLVNDWEHRRDHSHVRAYTVAEWRAMLSIAGLRVTVMELGTKQHNYAEWVARTQMPEDAARALAADMLAAPATARAHFAIVEQDGQLVSWTSDHAILRAER
jgi:SAM-dependent methyltransferase